MTVTDETRSMSIQTTALEERLARERSEMDAQQKQAAEQASSIKALQEITRHLCALAPREMKWLHNILKDFVL